MKLQRLKRHVGKRRGATVVEFALVLPILLVFILGLMEWGRMEMVRQATSTAAFNAARHGALAGGSTVEMESIATDLLDIYFVGGATVTSDITPHNSTVTVSVPMDQNSFVLSRFFGNSVIERSFKISAR